MKTGPLAARFFYAVAQSREFRRKSAFFDIANYHR
jgi:hypothetical protein